MPISRGASTPTACVQGPHLASACFAQCQAPMTYCRAWRHDTMSPLPVTEGHSCQSSPESSLSAASCACTALSLDPRSFRCSCSSSRDSARTLKSQGRNGRAGGATAFFYGRLKLQPFVCLSALHFTEAVRTERQVCNHAPA